MVSHHISQVYIICSRILHLILDSILLAPSTAPHGCQMAPSSEYSVALITLSLQSLALTAWLLIIYFSAQAVYP